MNVTSSDLSTATQGTAIVYGYGDNNWSDKLTSYDGQTISYDASGNPTSYRGETVTWNGRLMTSFTKDDRRYEYSYNSDGMRTVKRVYEDDELVYTYTYIWDGDVLLGGRMEVTDADEPITIRYLYDDSGELYGMDYNGNGYFGFIKNLQGDIVSIIPLDSESNVEVNMEYDAWGKPIYVQGSSLAEGFMMAVLTAVTNVGYRGYFYDFETGLYYLRSRYYDPEIGRYDRVVRMIEESEKLKLTAEDKAAHMADKLVPYTLGGTALTYLLTRNVTKMLSVLMVDFSCALKLAIPIAVLSAMRESSNHRISVKGGRFMESVAKADTIVFDKTGTLTYATPTVAQVISFGGHDETEMLRLAACLEEHYPHSMANAVVEEANKRGLSHEEYHSSVQYIVAHGISSMVDCEKVLIGSAHFVFEDEGCKIPENELEKFNSLPSEYSQLYLCINGELAAVICIHDPLRKEAREAVAALHDCGFTNVVMMTGDNRRTAEAVAAEVGVDAVYSEVLPEDKAAFIRSEKEKGHTVIMVGDGVNDSPALSEADAGIAISTGAAIAREIADITIASEDLFELVTLRRLSEALMKRIHGSYRFIVGFNLSLILLGVAGILPPTTSELLHNTSTLCISLQNMTNLLDKAEE